MTQFLETPEGRIAYDQITPCGVTPGIVFVHGFLSNRQGSKALFLDEYCRAKGLGFVRFDCLGHGESDGEFTEGTISLWADNLVAVIDHLTDRPQILVGSSMGGWLMLLAALKRSERICGMIGLAAAPDFTADLMPHYFTPERQKELDENGVCYLPCDYDEGDPYPITQKLLSDGNQNLLLRAPIPLTQPLVLIQGQQDKDVPWQTALRIAERYEGDQVEIRLLKDAGHRLSRPEDLHVLQQAVETILKI